MEFVIPLDKNDLLQKRGQEYAVEELTSLRNINQALDATRKPLENEGPRYILNHFDDFFSVLIHGSRLEVSVTMRAYDRLYKTIDILVDEMDKNFPEEERKLYLCINKMLAYLISNLTCYLEDTTLSMDTGITTGAGQKKKNAQKSDARNDWEGKRNKLLCLIYSWLQLPLQNLWNPPIVEESFVMLLADICYKILENDKNSKDTKHIKSSIFQILGTLVKRYIHGITCTIRIMQLLKLHNELAEPLAVGVVAMITDNGCTGFIAEIAREIDQSSLDESEARNISLFIENIAAVNPKIILGILDNINDLLSNDNYSLRNCAISVFGIVIKGALTSDRLTDEEKKMRDDCFDHLEQHMLDNNAYVRSKVFQVFTKLCCEGALPIARFGNLANLAVAHLTEKSANVRKQALILLRALIEANAFRVSLDKNKFLKIKAETDKNMEDMKAKIVLESSKGDEERFELWKSMMPDIQTEIKKSILKEEQRKKDNDDNEKDDDEDENEDNEIDINEEFENIRQLIVNKEYKKSLKSLKQIYKAHNWSKEIKSMSPEEKEHWYFFVLLRIFMESEKAEDSEKTKQAKKLEWQNQKEQIQQWKRVMDYLDNAILFTNGWEKAMPLIQESLYADVPTVAIEACTLLQTVQKYEVNGSKEAIQKALSQVFSREESVRNNVAIVYKEIYLNRGEEKQANGTILPASQAAVNGLLKLFKGLECGQSSALIQLISIWLTNNDLTDTHIQIMWQIYTMKIPGTTIDQSRCAIALLTMVAESKQRLMKINMSIINQIGFETIGNDNILLARDSCKALKTIKRLPHENMEDPIRLNNDDKIFKNIISFMVDKYDTTSNEAYTSFATEAINVIYQLANQPGNIAKDILIELMEKDTTGKIKKTKIAKFLYVIGHIAIRHMVYLDTDLYKELKRRNAIIELKKGNKNKELDTPTSVTHSSAIKARRSIHHQKAKDTFIEDNGEEALGGATADDTDAEAIEAELENNIVNGDGFLVEFVPFILDVCEHPEKYHDKDICVWGVLALSKMMTVSSKFCQQHLQLLVTILERSSHQEIRSNILFCLSDLMIRFPNEVEPWTKHMYARLRDDNVLVRKTAVSVLANLVKREMIRVKGQMSEMALCIIDPDAQIRASAKQFFEELSHKGNILYNIMPDIISRLTSDEADIDEEGLHEILKNVLGLLQKEKDIDTLLDKICSRFQFAKNDRQWRDLGYCLSLLQLGRKGIIKLTENLHIFKNKIYLREIQKALKDIVDAAKRKATTKDLSATLERTPRTSSRSIDKENLTQEQQTPKMKTEKNVKLTKKTSTKTTRTTRLSSTDSVDNAEFRSPPPKLTRSTRTKK
ncbi:hypothetical protein HCN44_009288 [Aphidius gifuensis]|uniref:Condensin complex subunit 1 n=1 Tax=Aphidius gifuensis TaxID=684658 RepID=A0A834Y205_APHGI|nr:hypothetical protein HCN44_009288 [Aphidius gifuensis]